MAVCQRLWDYKHLVFWDLILDTFNKICVKRTAWLCDMHINEYLDDVLLNIKIMNFQEKKSIFDFLNFEQVNCVTVI